MTKELIERVEIEPGSLRKLLAASKTWDAASRRAMRANLRVPAEKAANEAKERVRGLPATKITGLREQLADGVKVKITGGRVGKNGVTGEGVRVVAGRNALPPNKQAMAAASMAKSFRHPVFGSSDSVTPWVTQEGHNWFYEPLRGNAEEYRAAIVAAIKEASTAVDAL